LQHHGTEDVFIFLNPNLYSAMRATRNGGDHV
jgi:hypothetical protein